MSNYRDSAAFSYGNDSFIKICADSWNVPFPASGKILIKSLLTVFYHFVFYKFSRKMRTSDYRIWKISKDFFHCNLNSILIHFFNYGLISFISIFNYVFYY